MGIISRFNQLSPILSNNKIPIDLPNKSNIEPKLLAQNSPIQFRCHKDISCWNACCNNADVTLAPFDVIRLKAHFGISSTEFLAKYTVPFAIDGKGLTGIKLRTNKNKNCLLVDQEGCTVYKDRPSACRYYPLGLMARKIKEEKNSDTGYCLIKEDHCKGHTEDNITKIKTYQNEQQVTQYDEHNLEWMEILLKKESAGPAIGQIPEMSLQLFFMCSFDIDRFRKFINSINFRKTYQLTDEFFDSLQDDDIALLKFGYRLMNQVFFAQNSIDLVDGALDERLESRKEVIKMRKKVEIENYAAKQEQLKREADEDIKI